jgi:hypothetical protein
MSKSTNLPAEIRAKWLVVVAFIEKNFNRKPDLNAVLFLIGMRELGHIPEKKFNKAEKTDLLHIATCKLLSYSGYYELKGHDKDEWPIWESTRKLPPMGLFEQENLIRQHVVEYFEREEIIDFSAPENE